MVPTDFDESTDYLNPPPGTDPDQVVPLNVYQGKDSDGIPVCISCWKVTREELDEITRTGRVWLVLYGVTMPPARLDGLTPFAKE